MCESERGIEKFSEVGAAKNRQLHKTMYVLLINLWMFSPSIQRAKSSKKSASRVDINGWEMKLHVTVEESSEKGNKYSHFFNYMHTRRPSVNHVELPLIQHRNKESGERSY